MPADRSANPAAREAARLALTGWQQRVQAVIEIARDSDDLVARLPVLDQLARELVSDIARAIAGLDALGRRPDAGVPANVDALRDALGKAHAQLYGIELWHRPPSVGALRKARDCLRTAADRLSTSTPP